jgi:hypothetical protein
VRPTTDRTGADRDADRSPPSVAVVMPVGPGTADVERLEDTAASLALEPAIGWLVLIDDGDHDRGLASVVSLPNVAVATLRPPRRMRRTSFEDRIAAHTLGGLGWAARNTTASIFMRLDADALVIGPFADKLAARFAADPQVGLVGSYDRMSNGAPRDFAWWERRVRRASRRISWRTGRSGLGRPVVAVGPRRARVWQYIEEARAAGYAWGENALGAAFAIRQEVARHWIAEGVLDDPGLFLGTGLGDDPVLGILVRRSGWRIGGMVDPGDPFALALTGLPSSPDDLLANRYGIIHCVKNDARWSEAEIREFFRRHRAVALAAVDDAR